MAIIDRIKYDGSTNGLQWLVHKYPSEQFVLGSQLIVGTGQEALFVKGGEHSTCSAGYLYPVHRKPAGPEQAGESALWRQNPFFC